LRVGWGFELVEGGALRWLSPSVGATGPSCALRLPDALRGRDTHQLGPGDCGPYCARRMPAQHYLAVRAGES